MREPRTALPSEIETLPDQPAVFLLWASSGLPYLARTARLRRRLKRLLGNPERVSRIPNLSGVVERIQYWPTGSQLESALIHLWLAKRHFPDDWQKITRLRPPAFVRLTLDNPFPRTMVTTRLGRGLFVGPFSSRATAEKFEAGVLDLFQIRRCEENLVTSPEHPGCMYGEMNKCIRPCQQAVSPEEYRGEVQRVEQFLRSSGASLLDPAEKARDQASAAMDFEEAERMHARVARINEVRFAAGDLAREISQLHGIAIEPSAHAACVDLWFLVGGRWMAPKIIALSETAGAGQSMDQRIRELAQGIADDASAEKMPEPEHLAILMRWHQSTWRDGEWIALPSLDKIPYRKIVNAIGRVATGRPSGIAWSDMEHAGR